MVQRKISERTLDKYKLIVDEWFVNGFNGSKAYQKFYPNAKNSTSDSNFRKILGITRIETYVSEKRNSLIEELQITLKRQLFELENLKSLSISDQKYSNAIEAIKEQNRLLGFYAKDNSQKNTSTEMSPEEREARIEELLKKRNASKSRKEL